MTKRRKPNDHDRLFAYVEAVFKCSKNTEWPTVRQVARAFKWMHTEVENAVEGDPDCRMFLSGYNFISDEALERNIIGSLIIESYGEEEKR